MRARPPRGSTPHDASVSHRQVVLFRTVRQSKHGWSSRNRAPGASSSVYFVRARQRSCRYKLLKKSDLCWWRRRESNPRRLKTLTARDFRRNSPGIRCLAGNPLCSGVLPSLVAVGTPVARRPPLRSGRAEHLAGFAGARRHVGDGFLYYGAFAAAAAVSTWHGKGPCPCSPDRASPTIESSA